MEATHARSEGQAETNENGKKKPERSDERSGFSR